MKWSVWHSSWHLRVHWKHGSFLATQTQSSLSTWKICRIYLPETLPTLWKWKSGWRITGFIDWRQSSSAHGGHNRISYQRSDWLLVMKPDYGLFLNHSALLNSFVHNVCHLYQLTLASEKKHNLTTDISYFKKTKVKKLAHPRLILVHIFLSSFPPRRAQLQENKRHCRRTGVRRNDSGWWWRGVFVSLVPKFWISWQCLLY